MIRTTKMTIIEDEKPPSDALPTAEAMKHAYQFLALEMKEHCQRLHNLGEVPKHVSSDKMLDVLRQCTDLWSEELVRRFDSLEFILMLHPTLLDEVSEMPE